MKHPCYNNTIRLLIKNETYIFTVFFAFNGLDLILIAPCFLISLGLDPIATLSPQRAVFICLGSVDLLDRVHAHIQ